MFQCLDYVLLIVIAWENKNDRNGTVGSEVSIFGHFHHTKPSGHQVVTKWSPSGHQEGDGIASKKFYLAIAGE